MIFRTTLKAGEPNVFSKVGRYFYLLTAADSLRIRFSDSSNYKLDFESEMREGMSADFKADIDEITLSSDTPQYVEFWLGRTKLDYSKIAAGGAAANIGGGTVFCPAGKTLAIPADFRRKAVSIKVSDVCQIGGLDVDLFNGFTLEPNEKIKADSRGDIWVYREPAKITIADGVVEKPAPQNTDFNSVPTTSEWDVNVMKVLANGVIVAQRSNYPIYSEDDGATWAECTFPQTEVHPNTVIGFLRSSDGCAWVDLGYGKLFKSVDGKEYLHVTTVYLGQDVNGNVINEYMGGAGDADGEIFDGGKTILYANYDRVFISYNGGLSWNVSPVCERKQCRDVRFSADKKSIFLQYPTGHIYKWDYADGASEWALSVKLYNDDCQDTVAIVGSKIFKVTNDSGTRYIHVSADDGLTWSTLLSGAIVAGVRRVLAIGASVVFFGANRIGVINDVTTSLAVNWYESGIDLAIPEIDNPSAVFYDQLNSTVNVLQSAANNLGDDSWRSAIVSYPISVTSGYLDGITVSWLAELN